MEKAISVFGAISVIVVTAVALGLLMSLPVYWLWNGCLVPAVDGIHEVSWLQAWGIYILCNFLFKLTTTKS